MSRTRSRGLVKVRLSGDPDDIEALAASIGEHHQVLSRSAPRPNRRDPGVRVYLDILPAPADPAGVKNRA